MGMYTGLRGTVILNDLGRSLAANNFDWPSSEVGAIKAFGNEDSRNCFIPFGAHSYMPDEWGKSHSIVVGDKWDFSCSLKNYEGTIDRFISDVLPLIAGSWRLEKLYEESEHPTIIIKE